MRGRMLLHNFFPNRVETRWIRAYSTFLYSILYLHVYFSTIIFRLNEWTKYRMQYVVLSEYIYHAYLCSALFGNNFCKRNIRYGYKNDSNFKCKQMYVWLGAISFCIFTHIYTWCMSDWASLSLATNKKTSSEWVFVVYKAFFAVIQRVASPGCPMAWTKSICARRSSAGRGEHSVYFRTNKF